MMRVLLAAPLVLLPSQVRSAQPLPCEPGVAGIVCGVMRSAPLLSLPTAQATRPRTVIGELFPRRNAQAAPSNRYVLASSGRSYEVR